MRERLHKARKRVAIITPDEAKRRLDPGGVTLIDVDEEWQLRERGTIAGARNMRGELEIRLKSIRNWSAVTRRCRTARGRSS